MASSSGVVTTASTNPAAKGQPSAIEEPPEWTNTTNLASATFGGTIQFATDGESERVRDGRLKHMLRSMCFNVTNSDD